jgi:hypothetical protein
MTDVLRPNMAGSPDVVGGNGGSVVALSDKGGGNKSVRVSDLAKGVTELPISNGKFSGNKEHNFTEEKDVLSDLPADLAGHDNGQHIPFITSSASPRPDGHPEEDEVDALPENLRYNWFDLLCTLISIATYVVDLVMDCIVAYYFYHLAVNHGIYHYWYFGLTTFFIVLPCLTMTGFSFRWYVMDSDDSHVKVSTLRWIIRLIVLFFQVAPLLRYMDSIRYGILSRIEKCKEERAITPQAKQQHRKQRIRYYTLMVFEDADATLLRLFESFMESAPQLVLQIYILIKDPYANRINKVELVNEGVDPYLKLVILILSVTSSLISLAWSLVVYHRSLR